MASLNKLMQKTRRRGETRDKRVEREGVREGLKEEASITPASYLLRADSIDLHFLYVSLILIRACIMYASRAISLICQTKTVFTSQKNLRTCILSINIFDAVEFS